MLATASLGAVWSSASPDFGANAVIDRFGQIAPKVFFAVDGYRYAGKEIRLGDKLAQVIPRLPAWSAPSSCPSSARPSAWPPRCPARSPSTRRWRRSRRSRSPIARVPFAHPLYHPVLLGHHRRAQMHRPFGRRHAAPASQGAPPAFRHRRGRPRLLFHHARLDDVELAGLGPGLGSDAAPLRRLALPSRAGDALRLCRGRSAPPSSAPRPSSSTR